MKLDAALWSKAALLVAMTAFGFGAGHSVGQWGEPDRLTIASERGQLSLGTWTIEGYEDEEGELVELFGLLIRSKSSDASIGLFVDEDDHAQILCGHAEDRMFTVDTSAGVELDLRTIQGTSGTIRVNDQGDSVAELRSPGAVTQLRSSSRELIHLEVEADEH